MIQINLLKTAVKKKPRKRKFSPNTVVKIYSAIGIVLALTCIFFVMKYFKGPLFKTKQQLTVKDDYTPSTFTDPNTVEETVRDLNDANDKLKQSGFKDIPYSQMSFIEKVNYEICFAKNVCDLLTRTVLPGVDFKILQAGSFNSFNGTGICSSKDNIIMLLKSLKNERVEILPKPQTIIRKNINGYQFTIACTNEFGLNTVAPFFLGPDDLPEYEDLEFLLKKMVTTAEDDNVTITSGPKRIDAFLRGDYRQFRYHISGTSTYPNFVAYINNLYNRQIPCAFEMFTITALNEISVKIEADIIFTTSN
jgi:hypothetical protein